MTPPPPQPLRVELTLLDERLYEKQALFFCEPTPHLLYSTLYKDAVSTPFPNEGKIGLSVFIGTREQFRLPKVPLLWQLEKRRGRQRLAVVTNLRGKEFIPAYRELEGSLTEPLLAPVSFLRRRGSHWDSLDFFSSGWSPTMEGAAPRLRRLKQYGWEMLVDRLSVVDPSIKELYFETLFVERPMLQQALVDRFQRGDLSLMVGIAGNCLQTEHLPILFKEAFNARLLSSLIEESTSLPALQEWIYLGKRDSARELLLFAHGDRALQKGDVLVGQDPSETRSSELFVSDILQHLPMEFAGQIHTVCRVAVEWRYKPAHQIPVAWQQISTTTAGASDANG